MCNRVLLVDDEVNLLQSIRRNLRGRYDLTLAEGGAAGLEHLKTMARLPSLSAICKCPKSTA